MERVRQKMEEVIQKQKRLQEQSHATTESRSANDKSQYILALGGVAAGLTIAVIVWLAKSILATEHINMIAPETADVIHPGEIKKSSDVLAQLNERVELLTESISNMEAKLMRVMALNDSISNIEEKYASSSQQDKLESAEVNSAIDMYELDAPGVHVASETEKPFVPTHTVNAKLNLRPSASLNSRPSAVLKAGTKVEYISQADGWYYVKTRYNGKGWCSSDYLSPLLPTQEMPSTN